MIIQHPHACDASIQGYLQTHCNTDLIVLPRIRSRGVRRESVEANAIGPVGVALEAGVDLPRTSLHIVRSGTSKKSTLE